MATSVLYSPYRKHVSDVKRDNLTCEDTTIIGVCRRHGRASAISAWSTAASSPHQEDRSRAFVAVIGDTVQTTLFPGDASPLGQIVRIEGIEFTVVGVQEKLGSAFGRDQDNSIYIPVIGLRPHVRPRQRLRAVRPPQAGQRPESRCRTRWM